MNNRRNGGKAPSCSVLDVSKMSEHKVLLKLLNKGISSKFSELQRFGQDLWHTLCLAQFYCCTPASVEPGASLASVEVWRLNIYWPMIAEQYNLHEPHPPIKIAE